MGTTDLISGNYITAAMEDDGTNHWMRIDFDQSMFSAGAAFTVTVIAKWEIRNWEDELEEVLVNPGTWTI